ncbi:patatin-like phospholipase family protein [Paraburkholderia tropica]|uniref:patatin-like phospholipase family protein n=1 Tax=Paraburkholderia tropica TaxID=92647 RepID=UPI002AAFB56C|nr:patatin-like phospholipase family protein [Paraburkholderia tropica]
MNPVRLQVAFQGGGAKVFALLAAAQAFQELQRNGKIQITRIAGTSAGSIVASFLAADISIDAIRAELSGGEAERLAKSFKKIGYSKAFQKIFFGGSPIWSDKPLQLWLQDKFREAGKTKIRDISEVELLIVKSDIGSSSSVIAPRDEDIDRAIIDSCALPFLLRIWKQDSGASYVDGGIAENLALDRLAEHQINDGPCVAVSFPDRSSPSNPNGLLNFSLSLLDTAITAPLTSLKRRFPHAILELPTQTQTFDVAGGIKNDLSKEKYYHIVSHSKTWIENFLKERDRSRRRSNNDIWSESNETAKYLMSKLGEIYRNILGVQKLTYHYVRFQVAASSHRDGGLNERGYGSDQAFLEMKFSTLMEESPVTCLRIGLLSAHEAAYFLTDRPLIRVIGPNGAEIEVMLMPMRFSDTSRCRDLCVFFHNPLPPHTGPYTVHFYEDGVDFMADLMKKNEESLDFSFPPRAVGGIVEIVDLALYVPEDVDVVLSSDDSEIKCKPLGNSQLREFNPVYPRMKAYGMRAWNVSSDWKVRIMRRERSK